MPYKKGNIVLVPFPFSDSDAEKKRPAVIIQGNSLNRRLDTVIIAQITSNMARVEKERTQVPVYIDTREGRLTGLLQNSAIKCETVATLSKSRILKRIGNLTGSLMKQLDDSLKSAFGLEARID